jgi:putative phosphoribosyl transferase
MFGHEPQFQDRRDAGRRLAKALAHLAPAKPLILALPRGGVPVAFEVAKALNAEMDLLFVRKIGAQGYEELGLGAVVDGADPQLVLNEDVVRELGPNPNYIRAEIRRQLAEIERRRRTYTGSTPPAEVSGRTVLVVDDGIATGATVKAESIAELSAECDEIVCLAQPVPFYAVGAHYAKFDQTSDDEVIRLVRESHGFGRSSAATVH